MKIIKQTYLINAPIEKVWRALTDPTEINEWGAGPVDMDDKVGTEFNLWEGDIHGKNIEVIPKKRLVQEWFSGHWEKPSKVAFTLSRLSQKTQIDLLHEEYPEVEHEELESGWREYYLGPMKDYLESTASDK